MSQEQQRALKIATIERQTQALVTQAQPTAPARSARPSVVSTVMRGRPASQPAPRMVTQRLQQLQGIQQAVLAGTGTRPPPASSDCE